MGFFAMGKATWFLVHTGHAAVLARSTSWPGFIALIRPVRQEKSQRKEWVFEVGIDHVP